MKTDRLNQVQSAVERFVGWLDVYGETSQDQQDFLACSYGRWAKELYYKRPVLGKFFVAPLIAFEAFTPSVRNLFLSRSRLPIADAHFAMGFAYLHRATGESKHYDRAVHFLEVLEKTRCPNFTHHCWGYPFDWQTVLGTLPKGTPMITSTPYCYDAFADVYAIDKRPEWRDIMKSIAEHVRLDLNDVELSATIYVASYTPLDKRPVVNANGYRARILATAARDFDEPEYWRIAERNLNFVLESQQSDGSWLYAMDGDGDFIDNFHTCFVLKHLIRVEELTGHAGCRDAIARGARYYLDHLLDSDGLPIPFAKAPRMVLYRRDLYDYAECINLALLLCERMPEWKAVLDTTLADLFARWQKPDGSFRSRQLRFGWDNCPMHRWAQAQLFRALTRMLSLHHKYAMETNMKTHA